MNSFRETVAMQRRLGVDTEWLTPEEIEARVSLINAQGVLAATNRSTSIAREMVC